MDKQKIIKEVLRGLNSDEYILTSNYLCEKKMRAVAIDCKNPLKCIAHIIKDCVLCVLNEDEERDLNNNMSNADDLAIWIMDQVVQKDTYVHEEPMTRISFTDVPVDPDWDF